MPTGATSTRPIDLVARAAAIRCMVARSAEAGARKHPAAEVLGLSLRTLQRWLAEPELSADGRPDAVRPTPAHALSPEERQAVLDVCNSQEFASLPPSQIVPRLADQGRYLASESSFYRILRAADQQHRPEPATASCAGTNQPHRDRPQSSVVLGYHLLAVTRPRPVLLPLSDRGHLQPQRGGLGSA